MVRTMMTQWMCDEKLYKKKRMTFGCTNLLISNLTKVILKELDFEVQGSFLGISYYLFLFVSSDGKAMFGTWKDVECCQAFFLQNIPRDL